MAEFTVNKEGVPLRNGDSDIRVRMNLGPTHHKSWYLTRDEAVQLYTALGNHLRDTREKALSEVNHEGHC